MNLTKKSISKTISKKLGISLTESSSMLDSLIDLVKFHSKKKYVKINGFGTFYMKYTPKRIGRNPTTKESYIIQKRKKLFFKASKKLKEKLN
tara:strand:+ start:145 stop:420 length:276 start_codon:yes stop_codon:yes gene_type:complete